MAKPYQLIDINNNYNIHTIQGRDYVLEETYRYQVKMMNHNIKVLQDIVNCFDDYIVDERKLWVSKIYRGKRFILKDDYDELRTQNDDLRLRNDKIKKQNIELEKQNKGLETDCDYLLKEREELEIKNEELKKQNEELRKFNSSSIIHLFNRELKKQNEKLKQELKKTE